VIKASFGTPPLAGFGKFVSVLMVMVASSS
jgi:hypothetical protein